jgi:uncharacterized protein (TIGR02996 family)
MADHEGFLQDILTHPDDEAPRLIYADWLEEQGGEAGRDRAAFIRLQCERARLPEGDPKANRLKFRERKLLKAHAAAWVPPLPPDFETAQFRRGFVEHVALPLKSFLDHAAALFAAVPLRSVALTLTPPGKDSLRPPVPLDQGLMHRLADSPFLGRLTALRFPEPPYNGTPLGDLGLRILMASPHVGRLRAFEAPRNELTAAAVRALDEAPFRPPLERLVLSRNRLGPEGAEALAQAKRLTGLTHLDLSQANIQTRGVRALARSANLAALRVLALSRLRLRVQAAQYLAGCEHLGGLRVLELNGNQLGDAGAGVLSASPRLGALVALALRKNRITAAGARALGESPLREHLVTIDLGRNAIPAAQRDALKARFGRRFARF